MALVKAIAKHGNSAGIILQQTLLKIMGWEVGTEIEIHVREDSIVLTRHVRSHNRRSTDRVPEK